MNPQFILRKQAVWYPKASVMMFTTVFFISAKLGKFFFFSFVFLYMFFNRSSHIGEIKDLALTVMELTHSLTTGTQLQRSAARYRMHDFAVAQV